MSKSATLSRFVEKKIRAYECHKDTFDLTFERKLKIIYDCMKVCGRNVLEELFGTLWGLWEFGNLRPYNLY